MSAVVAHSEPYVTLAYLEPWEISAMEHFRKIVKSYNYFHKSY